MRFNMRIFKNNSSQLIIVSNNHELPRIIRHYIIIDFDFSS